MIDMESYKLIRILAGKGLTKTEIKEITGHDYKTIKTYLKMSPSEFLKYQRKVKKRSKKFDEYKEEIIAIYKRNEYEELPVSGIYDCLLEEFGKLSGTEATLRNYIKYLKLSGSLALKIKQTRTYSKVEELPYGKQLQIDFGEYKFKSGLKIYIFCGVLSASRYKYVAFQLKPFTSLDTIHHLLNCFDFIGGIPEELCIDQDKVMVVSENYGDIIYTKSFKYFLEEMNLKMYVCRKSDPESKGKIENLVKFVKMNFLKARNFKELERAEESLKGWLRRANNRPSAATFYPPSELIIEERKHLKELRHSIFRKGDIIYREKRKVRNYLVTVKGIEYSIPETIKIKEADVYITKEKLYIFNRRTGEEIAEHNLHPFARKPVIKAEHRKINNNKSELKKELILKYDLKIWHDFINLNKEKFKRYFKDQYRFFMNFNREIKCTDSLEKALNFCVENKTYSMKDLKDTYYYYNNLKISGEEDILSKVEPVLKKIPEQRRKVRVEKRSLDFYKSLITVILGAFIL